MIWLAYEATEDEKYSNVATRHLDEFELRLDDGVTEIHNLGFLYTLSAVGAFRIMRTEGARVLAINAADKLTNLFLVEASIIQAGPIHTENPDERLWSLGQFSVDAKMNLSLLYWTAERTNVRRYSTIADSHAERTLRFIVRDDGSTFHSFKMDVETGEPINGATYQEHADESCWSRGQTWGLYGFALAYGYIGRD